MNLNHRAAIENGVLHFCQQNDILVTAYSPLKDGVLQNRLVQETAKNYGVTPGQVALAWLVAQQNVITIPKSTNLAHLAENLASLDLTLTSSDLDALSQME